MLSMKFVAYHIFILRYELRILLLGERISEAGVTQIANILFHFFIERSLKLRSLYLVNIT